MDNLYNFFHEITAPTTLPPTTPATTTPAPTTLPPTTPATTTPATTQPVPATTPEPVTLPDPTCDDSGTSSIICHVAFSLRVLTSFYNRFNIPLYIAVISFSIVYLMASDHWRGNLTDKMA